MQSTFISNVSYLNDVYVQCRMYKHNRKILLPENIIYKYICTYYSYKIIFKPIRITASFRLACIRIIETLLYFYTLIVCEYWQLHINVLITYPEEYSALEYET